ncbi:copper resistance protein CopC [Fictibacillus sp. KIGAM418]|uniref:Copper resistance protein CopC n=1 Tax=Fictibacillus marinisediminis TaxID=2878389 RepID=A0A9X2BC60_9BACL|nr:copper resistance CopC family protein [Fictibacillus marinisediminis]MCK6256614.1 copper resistance protein CopC [Fictibacillus marinisediminis]
MKKYILILTAVFFLCSASIASAHTGLESSQPAEGAVIKENLSKITLTFESKIENLSTMKVTKDGKPLDVKVAVKNNIMTGTAPSPLENGKYKVNYKIIGADGHIIQKDYSFAVQKPKEEKAVKEAPKKEKEKGEKTQKEEQQKKAEKAESKSNNAAAPLFIVVLLIVIIGAVLFIKRRKS